MSPMIRIRKKVFALTQSGMARVVGVSQGTVSRWEKGDLNPSIRELSKIRAEAFRRGFEWNDSWFFEAETPCEQGATS